MDAAGVARATLWGFSRGAALVIAATAEALGVELHVLRGLDHDTGLMEIDQVMAVVEPFLAAIPR